MDTKPAPFSVPNPAVKAMSAGELFAKTFPPEYSLIGGGLLSKGAQLWIGGAPKSYKSMVVNSICFHLVTGTPLWGVYKTAAKDHRSQVMTFPVEFPRKVLLLEQEVGEKDMQDRLRTLVSKVDPLYRRRFEEAFFIHSCDSRMMLDSAQGFEYINNLIASCKPDVLALDPFVEFHSEDENKQAPMMKVLRFLNLLRDRWDLTFLISHHAGKPSEMRSGIDEFRGSSVITGKGDSYIVIHPSKRTKGLLDLEFTIRRGKPIDDLAVQVNLDSLQVEFLHWEKTRKDRRVSLDEVAE